MQLQTRLLRIVRSHNSAKKWDAVFDVDGRVRTVAFGAAGYEDYTQHRDKARRARYRVRHARDNLTDPTSPGALSFYVLWGESTSMERNVAAFRRRFRI